MRNLDPTRRGPTMLACNENVANLANLCFHAHLRCNYPFLWWPTINRKASLSA